MTNAPQADTLTQAFNLVEQDRLPEARTLVQSILDRDPANADAWWIYAHAVEDPSEARKAIGRVLELDPTYPGAAQLSRQLQTVSASAGDFFADGDFGDDAFDVEDEFNLGDDLSFDEVNLDEDFEDLEDDEQERSPWLRRIIILAVILLLVVMGAFIVLTRQGDGEPSTPTQVADNPTATSPALIVPESTMDATLEATATQIILTESAEVTFDAQAASDLSALLSAYTLAESGTLLIDTTLGVTEVVSVCTSQETLRQTLESILPVMASDPTRVNATAQALGVRFVDCASGSVLQSLGTPIAVIQTFADGLMESGQYIASWTFIE